jgi:hypothetical protein
MSSPVLEAARAEREQLEKEKLARLGLPPEAVHDPRNALCLCVHHHDQHEHHRERVPRRRLPAGTFAWAAENGVDWLLDRTYPKELHR